MKLTKYIICKIQSKLNTRRFLESGGWETYYKHNDFNAQPPYWAIPRYNW